MNSLSARTLEEKLRAFEGKLGEPGHRVEPDQVLGRQPVASPLRRVR
jgi:hypothetical protein